jgi:ribonucleoside-diphosphate reductase alpha chain
MGFADTLFLLGITYDSESAVSFGENLMKFINDRAHKASAQLADERGPFPNWNESIWRTHTNQKMRNASHYIHLPLHDRCSPAKSSPK